MRSIWLTSTTNTRSWKKIKLKFFVDIGAWLKTNMPLNWFLETHSHHRVERVTHIQWQWCHAMPCHANYYHIFFHCLFQQKFCFCFGFYFAAAVVVILRTVNNGREQALKRFMSNVEHRFASVWCRRGCCYCDGCVLCCKCNKNGH